MEQEQKTTTNIKVPNNNMEVLKKHFGQCFDKNGNFDLEKFRQEISENEIDFYKESYGLDWLGKSYARVLASDEATTLLKEDEDHNQKTENKESQNLLIKGDNLEVLKHLSNAYHGKIKMIYIDPPYNTGSDGFVYEDDRKFTIQELKQLAGVDEEKAKRILDFTQSKSNSHSAWLTFMYPRLYIAMHLLKDDGVIFASIDDNEVAQLRLLMDEVFGEENFVANIIWQKKFAPANDSKWFSDNHDHIVVFSKDKHTWYPNLLERKKEAIDRYKNPDNDKRGRWVSGDMTVKTYNASYDYEITTPSGRVVAPPEGICWRFSEEKFNKLVADNRIWFGVNGGNVPRLKRFYSEVKSGITPMTIWMHKDVGHNQEAFQEVRKLFQGKQYFETPKPIRLLKQIINIGADSDDFILDFFAGSGTTGDAVMQLNAEDGGNRKYILVQLPEPIDKKKNKTAYDFVYNELGVTEPTIFDITKERLIRASKKIKEETITSKISSKEKEISDLEGKLDLDNKAEKIQQLKTDIENLKNQDLGFRIFETMPIWEDYGFEADELNNQIKLFDESTLSEEDLKALLTTWKTYDNIVLTENLKKVDFTGYTGYYADRRLYLMNKGFTTDNLKLLLEKIDLVKTFNPTSIIAFGYNFESKILREISENIKSYANKKNIDIDFITRY